MQQSNDKKEAPNRGTARRGVIARITDRPS